MTPSAAERAIAASSGHRKRAILMVFGCTVLGAAAQMLFKAGLKLMPNPTPLAVVTNWPLLLGLTLYGGSTVLLVLALREGELSLLYPVISLTYVWVTILSVLMLGETMNAWKVVGVSIIILGVCLLGRGGKS